ncbi:MAG: hypothetical protein AB2L17_06480 [Lentimicrobium sp.]
MFIKSGIRLLAVFLMLIFIPWQLTAQETKHNDSTAKHQSQKARKQNRKNEGKVIPAPDLTDPAFIDYLPATLYMTPDDSINTYAYLRRNFTDQFVSLWGHPGRVYPASRIFAIRQNGKYYRACRMDARNSVFGEQVVKGKMNLYYTRRLPQEAGLLEFITTDPNSGGYRNFMILQYEGRKRFEADYYYFVTFEDDSLQCFPINDFAEFAGRYLKDAPEAYNRMMGFASKRGGAAKVAAPLIAAGVVTATLFTTSLQAGLLVSAPFIAGGMGYAIWRKKKGYAKPDPEDMAGVIRAYNSVYK